MPQMNPFIATFRTPPQMAASPMAAPAAEKSDGFSFNDFIDIINPLQHLPVVGTLYRAITGDKIGTAEKIAGDTLYGGLWGAVASVADSAFEAVTGKNVGDTVLALFTGSHDEKKVALASAAPQAVPASVTDSNISALTASLSAKGVDSELAQRAVMAYQRSMTLPNMALASAR